VTRIAPGVVSLVAELRGHERQAAEELGQWKTRVEERKPLDASAAIALAMLLTDEELDSLEKRGSSWRTIRWTPPRKALNRLRAMVSLPKYSPRMPRPPSGDRGWMA
jgi:hypothetical protein